MADTIAAAFSKVPGLVQQVRELADDHARLQGLLEEGLQVNRAISLQIADLKADKAAVDQRNYELIAEVARLQRLILSAGQALRDSSEFQEAAQGLIATPRLPSNQNGGKAVPLPTNQMETSDDFG